MPIYSFLTRIFSSTGHRLRAPRNIFGIVLFLILREAALADSEPCFLSVSSKLTSKMGYIIVRRVTLDKARHDRRSSVSDRRYSCHCYTIYHPSHMIVCSNRSQGYYLDSSFMKLCNMKVAPDTPTSAAEASSLLM